MRFSDKLKHAAAPIFTAQLNHPFVKGLADGTLALDKFRHYMIQDSLYIVHYARAIAWVAALMPDVEDTLAMLDAAAESFRIEASLKTEYFEQFGITLADALKAEPAPACNAYIDHLFRYTRSGTLGEAMAAILPCGWVYVEIGHTLTAQKDIPDHHPYKSWLLTYAVPEFRDMVNWWFEILERAVEGHPEPELSHIQHVFLTSCRYEWMFWDMGWNKQEWKP